MKRFLKTLAMGMACVLFCGCGAPKAVLYQAVDTAMGTVIQQSMYTEGKASAKEISDGIKELLEQLEQQKLSWRLETSELFAVNESAGEDEGYLLSEELTALLADCLEVAEKSSGAFDVTLLPVVQLWNIDAWAAAGQTEAFLLPEEELIQQTLMLCGSEKVRLEPEVIGKDGEVLQARIFLPQGMQLDLGAVGKGAALTQILKYLEQSQVSGAVIAVGGSVLTYGEKPDKSCWRVGIVNPRDTASNLGVLSLEGQWCVSTSGDYERYVEADGVRYHHIMDPANGMPADSGVCSVTVLTKDGFLSDALSTACFILGEEKGMALARQYGAEVLFVTLDGDILMSEGMEQYFVKK